jgi:hypothetical protein
MGTTNLLPFNPLLTNAESDSAYASDTMRTGGAVTDALLPSAFFNKLMGQMSLFVAALAQALANKGFSTHDSDGFAALVAQLANIWTTADNIPGIVTVPYASSIAFDASAARTFQVTLTGDVTASSLANAAAGELLIFILIQDGVGEHAFAWPSNVPGRPIAAQANSVSAQAFIVGADGTVQPLDVGVRTQTAVSNALGYTYQNTGSNTREVSVLLSMPNNASVAAYSDASPTPSTLVGQSSHFTGYSTTTGDTISFKVLPGNYYVVKNIGSAAASVQQWIEYQ